MSLAAQCSLGRSPTESFQVDVVGDMLAKFQEQEERCLCLENSGMRVCDLILGSSDDQVWPTNHMEEAIGRFLVMQEEQREAIIELEALQSSTAQVWDMVLKGSDGMSSLARSLSSAADLIEGRVDAAVANGVHWEARLALTTTLSHFPELELLGSRHNADFIEGQLDAILTQTPQASKSLAFSIPLSVVHDSPDVTGEE
jgi:hypothetical protein